MIDSLAPLGECLPLDSAVQGAALYTPLAVSWLESAATTRRFQSGAVLRPGGPLSDAVLTGESVWVQDAGQWQSRYPPVAAVGTSDGFAATACLPLRTNERDLGAIVFGFTGSGSFSPFGQGAACLAPPPSDLAAGRDLGVTRRRGE